MTIHTARSEPPSSRRAIGTAWQLVVALVAMLVLAWVAASLFGLDEDTTLAGCGVLVALALMAAALRNGLGKRKPGAELPAANAPMGEAATARAETTSRDSSGTMNGKRWSLDVFAAIDAQRFAAVCETWFSWAGFDTRTQSHRTDGGVDIWLHAARMPGPVAIVRCKHWLNKPVGLAEMKDFLGVVANSKTAHGTYTTTSTYTPEALQFAREHGIDAVDGRGLLRRIQTRTRQRQQALLAVAYSGQN